MVTVIRNNKGFYEYVADDALPAPVLAATNWPSNADLIVDCVKLGYLSITQRVLDPTYGNGTWWTKWSPAYDLFYTHVRDEDGSDFRHLPYPTGTFDAIAYDPPYVSVGGRTTTGLPDFHARYGMDDAPTSPACLQGLIDDGLTEMHRLVRVNGFVLVKCQDYVSSGKLWLGTHHTLSHALSLGFTCFDRLEHIGGIRPQPPGRRQVHARRNLSTMFVLQKRV